MLKALQSGFFKKCQMHRILRRQDKAIHKYVLNEMNKLVETRRYLGGQTKKIWMRTE